MASDDELKDEELVDFEGSDYDSDFDYDGELEALENEYKAIDHMDSWEQQNEPAEGGEDSTTRRLESSPSANWQKNSASETLGASQIPIPDPVEPTHSQEGCNNSKSSHAASGENLITEERDTIKGTETKGTEVERGSKMEDVKESDGNGFKIGSKPELEDGELDETAMPHNEHTQDDDRRNGIDGPEWKRRKVSVTMAKKVSRDAEQNCLKETDLEEGQHTGSITTMQHIAGVPPPGGRVLNMRMIGLAQGSLTPGIIGPVIRPGPFGMARGFGPFGRFGAHGRPSVVRPQETLTQEHFIRAHALHLSKENLATAIRSSIARPLGAGTLNPFFGLDGLRPRAQIPKHFVPQPDIMVGRVENLVRGQRLVPGAGRSSPGNKSGVQTELSGITRPLNWMGPSGSAALERSNNGHVHGPNIRGGLRRGAGSLNAMHGGAVNPTIMSDAAAFGHFPPDEAEFHKAGNIAHNEFDARWKIERERMLRNGSYNIRESVANFRIEINRKRDEFKAPVQESSQPSRRAAQSGLSETKVATKKQADAPISSSTGSNIIKLHQPVQKSRILVVSGLPEDTCMSIVVEAFEKLGKITDFQKSKNGGTFTISYSSEDDAVTAKRNLHRSCLAGKRITVDYVY